LSVASDFVERALAHIGADLLVSVVDALAAGPVPEVPQDHAASTYAQRLTREDGAIEWTRPAAAIHNLIRGLYPWPHAHTYLDGRRLILLQSHVPSDQGAASPLAPVHAGTIVDAAGDRLLVATGDGILAVDALQAEGRRPMTTREFLAGSRLAVGDTFTSGL
jgi:methionyl-tRNA formyltransferase